MDGTRRRMSDIVELNREKLKAVFVKIDQNGNGLLDKTEFSKFIEGIGLNMTAKEVNLVFKTIDTDIKGQITAENL
jgi:Ca2+-binding EF-hand superfamily protein